MPNHDRRAAARRRAWGRGPAILRFEPMEGRQLLSAGGLLSDLSAFASSTTTATSTPSTSAADTSATSSQTDSVTAANLAATASANAAGTTETVATTGASSTATAASTATGATAAPSASTFDGSNLVVTAFDGAHNLDWGDSFHVTGTLQNLGSTATQKAYDVVVYASADRTIDTDAQVVATIPIAAGIASGGQQSFDQVVTAPRVPMANLGSSPSYYLIPKLVPGDGSSPAPSATTGSALTSVVTVTAKVPPVLVGAGVSVSPNNLQWGGSLTVTANVRNSSQGAAPATNARIVLTPVGQTPGGGSDYEIGQVAIPPVGGLQTVTATQTLTLPRYAPTALANSNNYTVTMVQDADATANPLVTPALSVSPQDSTTLSIASPPASVAPPEAKPAASDLAVVDVQEPSPTIYRGATFTVGATVRNTGAGDAGSFKVRFLLLTDESANAPAYVLGDASLSGLAAGMEQDILQTVTLPYTLPAGFAADSSTARVVAEVDPDRAVDQTVTSNDTLAAPQVQLKVLSTDGTTSVPVLPGASAATSQSGTVSSTALTPATPTPAAASASNFTSVTVAATDIPTVSATAPATTTTTATTTAATTATATSAATVHTQVITKAAAAKAKAKEQAQVKAEAQARAKAQAKLQAQARAAHHRAVVQAHALKVYHPAKKA